MILKDEQLLELDPNETLKAALQKHWHLRLANAKLMTTDTPCLASIALPVRLRFLELVAASEVPYGKPILLLQYAYKLRKCNSDFA